MGDSTTVVLAAAGSCSRWNNHLNIPKHMALTPDGESVLHRAVRLFSSAGARVVITGPDDDRYRTPGAELVVSVKDEQAGDLGMYTDSTVWNPEGRTILSYGDVYFTEQAVRTIMGFRERQWHGFARLDGSQRTGNPWNEFFAHSFWPEHHREEQELIRRTLQEWRDGRIPRAMIWEMYKLRQGKLLPFSFYTKNFGSLTEIDDWTDDFDMPWRYHTWMAKHLIAFPPPVAL